MLNSLVSLHSRQSQGSVMRDCTRLSQSECKVIRIGVSAYCWLNTVELGKWWV